MHQGRIVFSQIMDYLPNRQFKTCVNRYRGDHRVRTFTCLDQFYCMSFAQLTGRESLRDIEACLRAVGAKLYHAGMKAKVSRTTLAKANEQRDWRIYRDIAMILIDRARMLYAHQPLALNLKRAVYALDSTVVDLCLTLFPWAQHRRRKSAVKINTQLDLRGNIPAFIRITGGQIHDVHFLDHIIFEAGAFYIMDKGYTDFQRLYYIHQQQAFFVIRAKNNLTFSRRASHPVIKGRGLRSDQTIRLIGPKSSEYYPERLRRIHYVDAELNKRFFFLTNNFNLSALTITRLYKLRWQVGVSSQGHIIPSVEDRPRLKDSSLVAWEAPWRESKTAEPSDNMLAKEYMQRTRLQRTVNADVASLHEIPVAETVDNVRKQQEFAEMSPIRQLSPAGYQRRHGVKDDVETGETLDALRRKLVEEVLAITVSGKCKHRHQGGGSGRSTYEGRAAKRVWREGPGPVSIPFVEGRQG